MIGSVQVAPTPQAADSSSPWGGDSGALPAHHVSELDEAVPGEVLSTVSGVADFDSNPWAVTGVDGNTKEYFHPWIDGGSFAYQKGSEHYSGSASFQLAPMAPQDEDDLIIDGNYVVVDGDSQDVKPYYGSLYTDEIDFTGVTSARLHYKYLVTDSRLSESDYGDVAQSVKFEASIDGGVTFQTIEEWNSDPIAGFEEAWRHYWQTERCDAFVIFMGWCEEPPDEAPEGEEDRWWTDDNDTTEIPAEFLTSHTILRIKSYYDQADADHLRFNIDDLEIEGIGGDPVWSRDSLTPGVEPLPDDAELYDEATFNEVSDGVNVMGVWLDGGRNSYLTEFMANTTDSASGTPWNYSLRYSYVEGEANEPDPETGADQGEHKPTYSSIVTANTDLSAYDELSVEFELVAYNTTYESGSGDGDYLELSVSSNAGFDFVTAGTWVAGEDFVNNHRYQVQTTVPASLTSDGRFTTTTQLRIQSHSAAIENQFYIDNVKLYTAGSGTPFEYGEELIEWSDYEDSLTVINADTAHTVDNGATYIVEGTEQPLPPSYDLFNSALIDSDLYDDGFGEFDGYDAGTTDGNLPCNFGAVEHTDVFDHESSTNVHESVDGHTFGPHITMYGDADLGADAFLFSIHQTDTDDLTPGGWPYPYPDTDRCRTDAPTGDDFDLDEHGYMVDRQRLEVKSYEESPDYQLGDEGETHYISWKMHLPETIGVSNKFTHLHQLKPKGGDFDNMPTFTLTAVSGEEDADDGEEISPPQLNLRYSPTSDSQVTAANVDLTELTGRWVQIAVKVTFGTESSDRRYEIVMLDPFNLEADPIFTFGSDSLVTHKGGFNRWKWGIYRSIQEYLSVGDEHIGYADFVLLEVDSDDAINGDLLDFAAFANDQSSSTGIDTDVPIDSGSLICEVADSGVVSDVLISESHFEEWQLEGEMSFHDSTEDEFCQQLTSEYGPEYQAAGRCGTGDTIAACDGVVLEADAFSPDSENQCLIVESRSSFLVIHSDNCFPFTVSEES